MPQIGQLPGLSRTISGCIGQVYRTPSAGFGEGEVVVHPAGIPRRVGIKLCLQEAEQNQKVVSPCWDRPAALAGSTSIPQTGSFTVVLPTPCV